MAYIEPRKTNRRARPKQIESDCTETRKDMAFRGYVSALAARGVQLADMMARANDLGDFAAAKVVALKMLELVDGLKTNGSVVEIWEAGGCAQLLAETGSGLESGD